MFPLTWRVGVVFTLLVVVLPFTLSDNIGKAAGVRAPVFPNVQVSHDSYLAHSEPHVAENPQNPNVFVAGSKFFTDLGHYRFKIGTYSSTDAGRTWIDNGLLPGFESYRRVSDVSFAFSPKGTIAYAGVLAVNGARSGIFVSRSRDGGRSWLAPSTVYLDTSGATFSDKPWIAVDTSNGPHRGTVYVAWNLDATSRTGKKGVPKRTPGIAVARSTDYGRTFAAPVIVSPFNDVHFALGATPVVGPDGRLTVGFLVMSGPDKRPHYSLGTVTSSNGGVTFSPQRIIVPTVHVLPNHLPHGTFRNFSLPAFAASPVTPSLMVVWGDIRNRDADVLKSSSFDGGATWSIPARVNHDPIRDGKDQFQPALTVAPDGTYSCSWFDRRFDRGNRLIDVVVAQSRNDGHTFGANVRVTERSWNPAINAPKPGGKGNNTFIGDYQGIAADNGTVHPLWNDTQNGRSQEIRTASVPVGVLAGP